MTIAGNELDWIQLIVLSISAVIIGLSKTGVPGIGILVVPLMAMGFESKSSVGIVLPMLMCGDILASIYYRQWAQWKYVLGLMPWTVIGIIAGYFMMDKVSGNQLRPAIGLIVIAMLVLNYIVKFYKDRQNKKQHLDHAHNESKAENEKLFDHWMFNAVFGIATGIATMLANAAGPLTLLFFLSCGLLKDEFVGTRAWFCLIMNWLKVPFHLSLGIISTSSLAIDALALPFIIAGSFSGIFILKKLPQTAFRKIAEILALAAAIKLLIG